eukprot:CAMPEP_0114603764 /NCGR_PEP_ID=MMETSP0168-20121206/198_1 /TAXON_ID=95228 ORGANISM="Vannella sp., Strain DIVA3 517/6/12" /NCGR_SAMPLE_ID=MMETSP0168 /ASSEMBLY_ACC=CAM_ASM_000044 /LENGTH=192 /DNA_ID=CAMNT_0001814575 /DNA_START=450 /DNA_END=1030 /DNA_ORIENTATION=+
MPFKEATPTVTPKTKIESESPTRVWSTFPNVAMTRPLPTIPHTKPAYALQAAGHAVESAEGNESACGLAALALQPIPGTQQQTADAEVRRPLVVGDAPSAEVPQREEQPRGSAHERKPHNVAEHAAKARESVVEADNAAASSRGAEAVADAVGACPEAAVADHAPAAAPRQPCRKKNGEDDTWHPERREWPR